MPSIVTMLLRLPTGMSSGCIGGKSHILLQPG